MRHKIHNNFFIFEPKRPYSVTRFSQKQGKIKVMHQSIPAVPIPPPPPGQPRGICSHCQSRGWGIRNFIAARGLGISIPRGNLWAFDTRVFEIEISFFIGKDEAFVKDWLVHQGLEKLVDVFKGIFSQT